MADFKELLSEQQRTTAALEKMSTIVVSEGKKSATRDKVQEVNQARSEAAKVREAKKREQKDNQQIEQQKETNTLLTDERKSRIAEAAGRLTGGAKLAAKAAANQGKRLFEAVKGLGDKFKDGLEDLIPGGKDTISLLKKGLIAGAVAALVALMDDPIFLKIEDFVFEKFLPGIVSLYENILKPVGEFFIGAFTGFLNDLLDFANNPSWATFSELLSVDTAIALGTLLAVFAPFKAAAFAKGAVMLAAKAVVAPFKVGGFIVKQLGSVTSKFLSFGVKTTIEGFNILKTEFAGIGTKIGNAGKSFSSFTAKSVTAGFEAVGTRVKAVGKGITNSAVGKRVFVLMSPIRKGFSALSKRISDVGDSLSKQGKGALGKITGFGNKLFGATKGLGKIAGTVGRVAVGAAKFAGPVGAVLTAGMAAFDGVSAGITEFKESGKLGSAVKEGFAGAVSGLTFGLVDQETISGGMSKIGEKGKEVFKSVTGSIFSGIKSFGKTLMSFFTGDFEFPDFDLKSLNPFSGIVDKIKNSSVFEGALPEGDRNFLTSPIDSIKGVMKDLLTGVFGGLGVPTEEAPIDAFQFGGNIRSGQMGLVGEVGPELFVPNQDGRVVTNTRLEAIMNNALNRATTGEGGGGTTVINAPTNAVTNNSQTHSSPNAVRNNDPFFQRIAGFAI